MRVATLILLICSALLCSGCQNSILQPQTGSPVPMSAVPAVRLNFRYEADVPAPSVVAGRTAAEERDAGVQADFDANRPEELLDRTLTSPDKKKILAVYHNLADVQFDFRLDLYSPEGTLLKKLTPETMAVHFPDTIVWSPDSNSLAFVAMTRTAASETGALPAASPGPAASSTNLEAQSSADANVNADDPKSEITEVTPVARASIAAPTGILTFRTEQIYICGADGTGLKAVTENEGLMYFYYTWSPDSTMMVALAATLREWRLFELSAETKVETMIPQGRLRIIEKNGRERRLDDNLTPVRPVWSPDSSKVATAFDTQIRIYDAAGTNPTQAAIPLRNQLLISSRAYDDDQQRKLQESTEGSDANIQTATAQQPLSTLPDPATLVSYNPIVEIVWTAEDLLYLQTAYLRRMKNEADSVRSFSRWHRLVLTAQAATRAK